MKLPFLIAGKTLGQVFAGILGGIVATGFLIGIVWATAKILLRLG